MRESRRGGHPETPRVLFVYPSPASFVKTDEQLLRTFCDVLPIHFTGKSSYPRLLAGLVWADVVFCWFALGFAAVGSMMGKAVRCKSIIASGGWDVARIEDIGYGALLSEWGVLRAQAALVAADEVIAFSHWSEGRIREVAPRTRVRTAYLGVDTAIFRPSAKEGIVVCTAIVSRQNLTRKGLSTFAAAAGLMPDTQFVLVGPDIDGSANVIRQMAGDNLSITGWISDSELQALVARAQVYVQPSWTEGFGVALAEAMASGCVPVVTDSGGAMPELVGDAGYYVPYGNASALSDAIRKALGSDLGPRARRRVEERFSLRQRRQELRRSVYNLLGVGGDVTVEAMARPGGRM